MQVIDELNVRISQIIKRNKFFDKEQLDLLVSKLEKTNQRIDLYLLSNGLITENQEGVIINKLTGISLYNIDLIANQEAIIQMVSQDFLEKNHLLPIRKDIIDAEEVYTVVIGDVLDYNARRMAKAIFGSNAIVYYSTMAKLMSVYSVVITKTKVSEAIIEYGNEKTIENKDDSQVEDLSVTTAPAVKLAESIIKEAIASKASDIHIEPYEDIVRVRNRIDGVLYEKTSFDPRMYQAVVTRFKIIGGLDITERRIPQDGRFDITFNGQVYDFRLSTLPTVHGEKIVIRILDNSAFSFNLEQLGFTNYAIKMIRPALQTPHGIILLTGPTGCGKSTTLYSFIREINNEGVNIVSVEDPVEYSISGINQVQVNNKANMTFASALRSILRQDPNVIMIGEIRDEETAQIAIRSAITGHLVFSTLHTNDAPGAVGRLMDMGVEPYLVADALEMVIAQRLIRRLCPECKRKVLTNANEMRVLGLKKPRDIFVPIGCPACHNTGYKGRIGIHEILKVDEGLKDIIVARKTGEELHDYLQEHEFRDLRAACVERILDGVTSFSELATITIEE